MIRVLIVEDDKFARQGIIDALPWEEHGMVVAGEASNGKAALDILAEQKFDLILSDYSMPGMNGLELLKEVKEKYPDTAFGMITLYESFDIIQKALRYGAIDYISKIQLEEENFDTMLSNLQNKILERREVQQKAKSVHICPRDTCYLFSCINNQDLDILCDKYPGIFRERPLEIGLNIYACYMVDDREEEEKMFRTIKWPWYLVKVTGLGRYEQEKFFHLVRRYYRYHMFYYHESSTIAISWLERMVQGIRSVSEDEIGEIQEAWMDTDWLYDEKVFRKRLHELRELCLPFNVLFKLLVKVEDAVNRKYEDLFQDVNLHLPYHFYSWEDVSGWLEAVFYKMNQYISERQLSPGVMKSITKSIQIIYDEISSPLLVQSIAERVNMSRSYFSFCFKKVTGESFNQYVRDKRIKIAKEYLEKTDFTIMEIAEKCGYEDEKYFSRVFKQETGLLPTRYRKDRKDNARVVL